MRRWDACVGGWPHRLRKEEAMRRKHIALVVIASVAAVALVIPPAWASIFGEENVTLVKIWTEIMGARKELEDINDAAGKAADLTRDLLGSYNKVHAGIDELRHYSLDAFLYDLKSD